MLPWPGFEPATLRTWRPQLAILVSASTAASGLYPVGHHDPWFRLPQPGQLTIGEELLGYHNNMDVLGSASSPWAARVGLWTGQCESPIHGTCPNKQTALFGWAAAAAVAQPTVCNLECIWMKSESVKLKLKILVVAVIATAAVNCFQL